MPNELCSNNCSRPRSSEEERAPRDSWSQNIVLARWAMTLGLKDTCTGTCICGNGWAWALREQQCSLKGRVRGQCIHQWEWKWDFMQRNRKGSSVDKSRRWAAKGFKCQAQGPELCAVPSKGPMKWARSTVFWGDESGNGLQSAPEVRGQAARRAERRQL